MTGSVATFLISRHLAMASLPDMPKLHSVFERTLTLLAPSLGMPSKYIYIIIDEHGSFYLGSVPSVGDPIRICIMPKCHANFVSGGLCTEHLMLIEIVL